MNQDRIDKIGVSAAVDYFCMGGYVNPHITYDDKVPVWDGHLDVHNKKDSLASEDIAFKIDVQVKSSEVESFDTPVKHMLDVSELKHYKAQGGTLLIKVLIKGYERKIYFSYLGKIELNKYLEDCTDVQAQKTIYFVPAPEDPLELVRELRTIHLQGIHNLLSAEDLAKRNDFSIHFTLGPFPKDQNPMLWAASHTTDILVKLPESEDMFYMAEGPSYITSGQDVKEPVTVNGETYYDSFKYWTQKNGVDLFVGDFLSIRAQGNKVANLSIKASSIDLQTYIKELKFIIAISKYKAFNLGTICYDLKDCPFDEAQVGCMNIQYQFCNRLLKLFKIWGIERPQIDVRELSEETIENIDSIYEMYIHNISFPIDDSELPYRDFTFGKYRIFFGAGLDAENRRCLLDLRFCKTAKFINFTTEEVRLPFAVYLFTRNLFPDNLDYTDLIASFEECKNAPQIYDLANQSALCLINSFDKRGDKKLLQSAYDISKWCLSNTTDELSKNIYRLNILQCKKRFGLKYSANDNDFLINISSNETQLYFAANVLLGDWNRATSAWSRISTEAQEEIQTYPIYYLYEQIKSK